MRTVKVSPALAEALGKLVASREAARVGRVRLQDVEAIERELEVKLPDEAIAYLAAGISAWGDGPVSVRKVRELTLEVLDVREDWSEEPYPLPVAVIDDDSNGNYIAVCGGDILFLDHEVGFSLDEGPPVDLIETIEAALEYAGFEGRRSVPFAVELYDEPDPAPQVARVSHPKFGRGEVVAQAGDVVTVRFEQAGEKRLKRSFLSFE